MNASAHVTAAPIRGPKLDNRRVLAALVDLAIVGAGAALILFAGDSLTGQRQGALAAVILGWALYYFFALESGDGQTVGKRLMKLRVVRANGAPAGMREVAVRTVLRVVDNYLIGLIVMLATGERRQRIGDLAADTIVVDASAPAAAAPASAPVVEAEEPQLAEGPAEEPAAEDAAVATRTITLPSRPTPPATLADLTEPEPMAEEPVLDAEPVVEQPVVEEPVVEEPTFEEPVIEHEPFVADEPVAEEPAAEVAEEPLPNMTSPTIEGLAQDVAAARESAGEELREEPQPVVAEEPAVEAEPVEDEPVDDDGPVTVRTVETVSAMDLIMGAAEEDASDDRSESAHDPPDSA